MSMVFITSVTMMFTTNKQKDLFFCRNKYNKFGLECVISLCRF